MKSIMRYVKSLGWSWFKMQPNILTRKVAIGLMVTGALAGLVVSVMFGYNLFCGT